MALSQEKISEILNYNGYFSAGDVEYGINGPELVDGKIYMSIYHYLEFIRENPRRFNTLKIGLILAETNDDIKKCKYIKHKFEIKKYSFELLEENIGLFELFMIKTPIKQP